ncbi:MAG: hypothetical protein IR160_09605 [Salinibacterium sp.]|nr:hypothetical protein [Salinibacterium sp.]MBF0672827.1 hypothetical protein [Salinibacterium sp.]
MTLAAVGSGVAVAGSAAVLTALDRAAGGTDWTIAYLSAGGICAVVAAASAGFMAHSVESRARIDTDRDAPADDLVPGR